MDKKNKNLDKYNLRQVILDFPNQFEVGLELAKSAKAKGNFKSVVVSGMGGSSLPADILRTYLSETYFKGEKTKSFQIFQNRTYKLPREAYAGALNLFLSYSGNTEETIEALQESIKNGLPSIGIATGGRLEEICKKNNIPCVILPAGIQPRYATGYFFSAMLQLLKNCSIISANLEIIPKLAKKIGANILISEKEGKNIAKKIIGKTPIIYSTENYQSLAMIWKIKINENAKTPAFWNYFPELNHNEMVGFTLPQAKFHVLSLKNEKDHPQNLKRMEITSNLLKKQGIGTTFINMHQGDVFETIFSTLILGDWVSYYLALAYGQDPTPVDMVEDLKKLLA
jgi:glucose/mannose-6-phosphate isomerase